MWWRRLHVPKPSGLPGCSATVVSAKPGANSDSPTARVSLTVLWDIKEKEDRFRYTVP
jgi:hypothetical protein